MGKNKTLFIGFVLGIVATTAIQLESYVLMSYRIRN